MKKVDLNKELQAKHKKKREKKRVIPTYDTQGRTITPALKRRRRRIRTTLIVIAAILGVLYLPQFFLPSTGTQENTETQTVKKDGNAIKLATSALQDAPGDDFDEDGLTNSDEVRYGTDPYNADTDGDGVYDVYEVNVSKTDPTKADPDVLIDAQTRQDESNSKELASPYKIGNVILWASDYNSKAHGSVVEKSENVYHFTDFIGYAQFPDSDGSYAYVINENQTRTLLPHRQTENAWHISGTCDVEVYDEELSSVVEIGAAGKHLYVSSNRITDILALILPDRGLLTAQKRMRMDVTPDTRDGEATDIVKPSFDSTDTYRFTVNSNALTDLQYVRESIQDNACIAVSLFSPSEGEYIAIAYGYDADSNLYLADCDTLKPIGKLQIQETSKKVLDGQGRILNQEYFDFSGFGFSSANGDRICFFASSAEGGMEDAEKETKSTSSTSSVSTSEETPSEENTEADETEQSGDAEKDTQQGTDASQETDNPQTTETPQASGQ